MMADSKDADRRRFARTPVYGEIVGQIYTETAAPVIDLSEGGALLEVPCVLRPGAYYTLRLGLGQGATLLLKASVVRSYVHHLERFGQGETRVRYHAALNFINVTERERELLRLRAAGDESLAGALGARLHPAGAPASHEQPGGTPEADPLLIAAWPHLEATLPERRDSGRVNLDGRLEGEVGLRLESGVLMLSQGGVTLRMPFAPQIGSVIGCSLEIDGEPVQVQAIVRDAKSEAASLEAPRHVVGLEFVGLSESARSRIEGYVARRLKAAGG